MNGDPRIIEMLNARLSEELTAINQYMVHSEMAANWRYDRLHEVIEKRAIDEMKHAEKLIGRILFLNGRPTVSVLGTIEIGADIPAQLASDLASETGAVKLYNDSIRLAVEVGDNGTRDLLESILEDEEQHLDWLEAQLEQIQQMGLPGYLTEQLS